jgi:hypothetical protein
MDKAMDKLTKESEQLDELSKEELIQYINEVCILHEEVDYASYTTIAHEKSEKALKSNLYDDHKRAIDAHKTARKHWLNLSKKIENEDGQGRISKSIAKYHDSQIQKHVEAIKPKKMNESFGANILASIINNKPIEAQEQFGAAMSSILKTRIDNMRQDVAKNVFNNIQENEEWVLEDFNIDELTNFLKSDTYKSLDELSKETLGNYIKKATNDHGNKNFQYGMASDDLYDKIPSKDAKKIRKNASKREAGIKKAVDKLVKNK